MSQRSAVDVTVTVDFIWRETILYQLIVIIIVPAIVIRRIGSNAHRRELLVTGGGVSGGGDGEDSRMHDRVVIVLS